MEAPSSAGGFFYELIFVVLSFLPNCVRFFICSILCSFGLNQKNQKFKASESSAKMFARKPKILTIGSLTASPNHFVRFRLSAQTTEVFTAPSLHFYASLSRGHFPLSPKGGRNPKYSLLISTTNRHKAGSA